MEIIHRLNEIYSLIPQVPCRQCHQCCKQIMWFKPEEINIRSYLKKHNLSYITWSDEEFRAHDMNCPYLDEDGCRIYPVRPIVCRLQGVISELYCPFQSELLLTDVQVKQIMNQLNELTREIGGINDVYATRKTINNSSL